jgi:hypothetical protein
VFWACDFDCYTAADLANCTAYVQGWNTVIPVSRSGGYGGLYFLKHIHDLGLATYYWECASTSFRHGVTTAQVPLHIQQTVNAVPIPQTDHNNVFSTAPFVGGAHTATTTASNQEDDVPTLTRIFYDVAQTGYAIDSSAAGQKKNPLAASTAVIYPDGTWHQTSSGFGSRAELNAVTAISHALGFTVVDKHVNHDGWIMAQRFKPRAVTVEAAALDYDKLAAAVVAKLPKTASTLTAEQIADAVLDAQAKRLAS